MVQATTTMHEYLFCHEFANAVQVPSIYKHKTKTPMCTIVCFINLDISLNGHENIFYYKRLTD